MTAAPLWLQLVVAILLVISALCALVSALGLLRMPNFFLRMHPTALVYTGASWCVCLAYVLYFSFGSERLQLSAWIVIILLAITAPVTTVLLSRAALFRGRVQGDEAVPQPLQPTESASD